MLKEIGCCVSVLSLANVAIGVEDQMGGESRKRLSPVDPKSGEP